jgi:hypothetical protein
MKNNIMKFSTNLSTQPNRLRACKGRQHSSEVSTLATGKAIPVRTGQPHQGSLQRHVRAYLHRGAL